MEPIRIEIVPGRVRGKGARAGGLQLDSATASWGGRAFSALAYRPIADVCWQLVEAGCPDQPWQAYLPDGTRSLRGTSLAAYGATSRMEVRDAGAAR